MNDMGTIVFDGRVLPIRLMWIEDGTLHAQAHLDGPYRGLAGRVEYRMHGIDGSLYFMGNEFVDIPECGPDDRVLVTVRTIVIGKRSWSEMVAMM